MMGCFSGNVKHRSEIDKDLQMNRVMSRRSTERSLSLKMSRSSQQQIGWGERL